MASVVREIVDVELAVKRAGGRKQLAHELHGMLIGSMDEVRKAIEASWRSGDREALYVHVHKLNGSTRYCGVPALEYSCEQLEIQIKADRDSLDEAYRELLAAIDDLPAHRADFD